MSPASIASASSGLMSVKVKAGNSPSSRCGDASARLWISITTLTSGSAISLGGCYCGVTSRASWIAPSMTFAKPRPSSPGANRRLRPQVAATPGGDFLYSCPAPAFLPPLLPSRDARTYLSPDCLCPPLYPSPTAPGEPDRRDTAVTFLGYGAGGEWPARA
jgi:hypothetical protein